MIGIKAATAVLAAALILGCMSPPAPAPESSTSTTAALQQVERAFTDIGDCDNPSLELRVRDDCLKKTALARSKPADCMRISDAAGRDECSFRVAVKVRDRTLCASIGDRGIRAVCESKT